VSSNEQTSLIDEAVGREMARRLGLLPIGVVGTSVELVTRVAGDVELRGQQLAISLLWVISPTAGVVLSLMMMRSFSVSRGSRSG
jgi:hypothetical protein